MPFHSTRKLKSKSRSKHMRSKHMRSKHMRSKSKSRRMRSKSRRGGDPGDEVPLKDIIACKVYVIKYKNQYNAAIYGMEDDIGTKRFIIRYLDPAENYKLVTEMQNFDAKVKSTNFIRELDTSRLNPQQLYFNITGEDPPTPKKIESLTKKVLGFVPERKASPPQKSSRFSLFNKKSPGTHYA
jgi:hypothetical protein